MTKRQLKGKIVSNKMAKTVVVKVARYVKHPKYGKFRLLSKRYKAHNDSGNYQIGDVVTIEECPPISRDKHFRVVGVVSEAPRSEVVESNEETAGLAGGIKKFLHLS